MNELNKKPAAATKTNSDSKLTSQSNEDEIEQPFNIEEPLEESLPLPVPTRTKKQVQAPVLMSVSDFMGKSSSSSTTPTVGTSMGAVSAQGVEGNRRGGEIIREVEGEESKEGSEDEEDWDEGSGEEEGSGKKKRKRKGGKNGGKEQKVISGKDGLPQVTKSGGGDGDLKEDGNSAPSPKGILKNTTTDKGGKSVQFTQEVIQEDKAKKSKKKKEEEEEEEPPKRVSLFRQRMQGGNN